jgi:hypothetical protein
LILNLPRIADSERRDEAQLYAEFERNLPKILGGLLTAVSEALRRVGQIKLARKPRMADFALWATAAEKALGFKDGAFLETYDRNRAEAVHEVLESDPVATYIVSLMNALEEEPWEGTCTELRARLEPYVDESTKRSRVWPQSPRELSNRRRRLILILRESGIDITFRPRGTNGQG